MKGIILYTSRYGSTEQYAHWLGEDTGLPLLHLEETRLQDVQPYDFIIIGSNIRVGHIAAADWIKAHWEWLKEKRLLLFSCSGSYADAEEQQRVLETSLPEDVSRAFQYFPLPGRLDKSQLGFWDRIVVFLGSRVVPDEAARERMKKGFDYMDHEALDQLKGVIKRMRQVVM